MAGGRLNVRAHTEVAGTAFTATLLLWLVAVTAALTVAGLAGVRRCEIPIT